MPSVHHLSVVGVSGSPGADLIFCLLEQAKPVQHNPKGPCQARMVAS